MCCCLFVFAGSHSTFAVSSKSSRHLLPQLPRTGFSVECWACVEAGAGVPRVVISSGRFELGVSRFDRWRFTLYLQFPGKPIVGTRMPQILSCLLCGRLAFRHCRVPHATVGSFIYVVTCLFFHSPLDAKRVA